MTKLIEPITGEDHSRGRPDAPIVCVVYGDYECPYSRRAMTHMGALVKKMGDQFCFVFRHFPAPPEVHPQARAAAVMALAAAAQGQFWEMHATLFRRQKALDNDHLYQYADAIGLDLVRVTTELKGQLHDERMWRDLRSGWDSGVRSAPALFINGGRYQGEPSLAGISAAIALLQSQAA